MAGSGSEKRQRSKSISARFTKDEAETLRAMADRQGVSVACLIRSAVLSLPASRATRRPTISHEAAGRLVSALGTLAQCYRQAAEAAPDADRHLALLDAASRDLAEMRLALFQAMGREP